VARRSDLSSVLFQGAMFVLAGLTLVLLVAPTLVVLTVSFTDGFSLKFPPPGYSLRWYHELLGASQLHFAAMNSVQVALATTLIAVLLGVAGALAISRSQSAMARVLDSLFMSPLVLPALAFGFAALMTFSAVGWAVSTTTLVIGHAVVCVPYVIRTTTAALA
jgi:putative spermidine/putrescine transport system permease protein